jgi:hypothetical protein
MSTPDLEQLPEYLKGLQELARSAGVGISFEYRGKYIPKRYRL